MNISRQGYPLGALFVLVTLCAVLAAGVSPLVQMAKDGDIEPSSVLIALACGALCGITIGIIIGLLQFRIGLGMILGAGAGAVIGAAAGAMSLLSSDQMVTAAAAMTAGSGLVVCVAIVMRRAK
jgi:uncharacterized membrane protein